jgi:hypothetical protein
MELAVLLMVEPCAEAGHREVAARHMAGVETRKLNTISF